MKSLTFKRPLGGTPWWSSGSTAGATGLIPDQGTKVSHAPRRGQKKKKEVWAFPGGLSKSSCGRLPWTQKRTGGQNTEMTLTRVFVVTLEYKAKKR